MAMGYIPKKDDDNRTQVRPAAAKSGWHYQLMGIEFETSKHDSIVCNDHLGNSMTGLAHKIYNASDEEITSSVNEHLAVKTVIEFMPTFDYELVGGGLYKGSGITGDVRCWLIGVPDIAAPIGSKIFVANFNTGFLPSQSSLNADGRASKYMKYDAVNKTNKIQFVAKYSVGVQAKFMVKLEIFRS